MQGLKPFILPGVAAIILVALLVFRPSDSESESPGADAAPDEAGHPENSPRRDDPGAPPSKPPGDLAAVDTRPDSPQKTARDALHDAVTEALAGGSERATRLPTEYVRTQVTGELSRVASTCDAQAPGEAPVSLRITILGATQVGAVLEDVSLAPGAAHTDATLVRCLTHALLNATLPPPPASGSVTMVYPFVVGSAGSR